MAKKTAAGCLGTALLLYVVVGTGLMVAPISADDLAEEVTSVGAAVVEQATPTALSSPSVPSVRSLRRRIARRCATMVPWRIRRRSERR